MANYCMHCGTVLQPRFGLCPHCNREQLNEMISNSRGQVGFGVAQPAFATAVSQPISVVQAPRVRERRKHKSLLKILIAMVMTVVLLGVSLVTMGIYSIRQGTTEEALVRMVENAELSDLIALLGEDAEPGFYAPIKDYVLKNTGLSITNTTIDRVLEASELKYYLAEKVAEYAGDLYNGTENFALEQKQVYNLLRANRMEMQKALGVGLSDEVLNQMAEMLVNQGLFDQISTAMLKDTMPKVYYSLRFGLSYGAIAVLLAVACMIFVAMLRLDFSLGVLGGGVALAVTGGLFALPALLTRLSPVVLTTLVSNQFLQSAIMGFLNTNLIFSLLVFSVGMALILVRASILLLCKLFH